MCEREVACSMSIVGNMAVFTLRRQPMATHEFGIRGDGPRSSTSGYRDHVDDASAWIFIFVMTFSSTYQGRWRYGTSSS